MRKMSKKKNGLKEESEIQRFFRALFSRKITVAAACGVGFFILVALFAPWIAPYDPESVSFMERLQNCSSQHLLGTDTFGRDILSRLIYGARVSLLVGVLSTVVSAVIGTLLGMCCAYFKGWVDSLIMRICEACRAIPPVMISVVLIVILGNSMWDMTLIMGITAVPTYIRMMRASVLSVTGSDYVMVARLQGQKSIRIMLHHLLPNSISPMLVIMTQSIGIAIMSESGLSFLGLGISIPTASWGTMLNDAKAYLLLQPVYAVAPGVAIALLVLCMNLLGDGLRDAMDPRLRGEM